MEIFLKLLLLEAVPQSETILLGTEKRLKKSLRTLIASIDFNVFVGRGNRYFK